MAPVITRLIPILAILVVATAVETLIPLRIPRWLDRSLIWFWVTPNMHKMHHSRERCETDSNYGNLFSFYDRLFRSFTPSEGVDKVRYGLDDYDTPDRQSLTAAIRLPRVPRSVSA